MSINYYNREHIVFYISLFTGINDRHAVNTRKYANIFLESLSNKDIAKLTNLENFNNQEFIFQWKTPKGWFIEVSIFGYEMNYYVGLPNNTNHYDDIELDYGFRLPSILRTALSDFQN